MKKIIIVSLAAALIVGGAFAAKFAPMSEESELFKANVEVLAFGEGAGAGGCEMGETFQECGALIITWNGLTDNCHNLITVCNFKKGGCSPTSCSMHQ